jgi:acetyl-CoA C-acetyltransferase
MPVNDVVIVAAARTAMGGFLGSLSALSAPELAAVAIRGAMARASLQPDQIDELVLGNVLTAGVGQAPTRQAGLKAGLNKSTPCTGVSKVCGSGMKAVMMACDQVRAGSGNTIIAGGMESMSRAPYFLSRAREGMRLGHGEIKDHMFFDGLEDAYSGRTMGDFAQQLANDYGLTREDMDAFALESLRRANRAIAEGYFAGEIEPVKVSFRGTETRVATDEQPGNAKPQKIPLLKPAFAADGTITAANSSSISDGAAALILMPGQLATDLNLMPLARIVGHVTHAQAPSEFALAPIASIQKLFNRIGWNSSDVDLYEINEAFAMVTLLAMQALDLDHGKVNVNGGACALGHPIGASGARIIVTLLHALKRLGKSRGVASLCIGGGEATSIAVEMLQ